MSMPSVSASVPATTTGGGDAGWWDTAQLVEAASVAGGDVEDDVAGRGPDADVVEHVGAPPAADDIGVTGGVVVAVADESTDWRFAGALFAVRFVWPIAEASCGFER